ncbi:hypothetical protein V500_11180 [Pseudogymnoascus sp. VKM F-4518 (FW-2643)]|nr:hypothetical protein V500_11180 [Pseudogymnoascus sp. VKM F-4518 (FW-2643)]
MDPASVFGIATAIIGLVPICTQGFEMITACFKAPELVKEAMTLITVQKTLFICWAATLGLTGLSEKDAVERLNARMPHWELIGPGVLGILSAISDTFADVVILEGSYGLVLSAQDKMTYNAMLPAMLSAPKKNEIHHDPKTVANVARTLADSRREGVDKRQCAGYLLLSTASLFRKRVQDEYLNIFGPLSMGDYKIETTNWAIKYDNDDLATMACRRQSPSHSSNCTVYYIEWKSYRTHKGEQDADLQKQIQELAKVTCIKEKPSEFRVLDCLGAFKDKQNFRYGFVYSLPSHLQTMLVKDRRPGDISERRKPISLLMHIENTINCIPRGLDLGSRIALARQLAQSLLVLHAAGWVHKNICSQSIIFFLDRSYNGSGPSTTGRLDYKNPYLCGFGQSRPAHGPEKPQANAQAGPGGAQRIIPKTYIDQPRKQLKRLKASLYQHPAKRYDPKTYYEPSFDLYSLGCVLLEIALWQPLSNLASSEDEDPYKFRDRLVEVAKNEMPGVIGNIYSETTRKCLEIYSTTNREQNKWQCWNVVGDLDKCVI